MFVEEIYIRTVPCSASKTFPLLGLEGRPISQTAGFGMCPSKLLKKYGFFNYRLFTRHNKNTKELNKYETNVTSFTN